MLQQRHLLQAEQKHVCSANKAAWIYAECRKACSVATLKVKRRLHVRHGTHDMQCIHATLIPSSPPILRHGYIPWGQETSFPPYLRWKRSSWPPWAVYRIAPTDFIGPFCFSIKRFHMLPMHMLPYTIPHSMSLANEHRRSPRASDGMIEIEARSLQQTPSEPINK